MKRGRGSAPNSPGYMSGGLQFGDVVTIGMQSPHIIEVVFTTVGQSLITPRLEPVTPRLRVPCSTTAPACSHHTWSKYTCFELRLAMPNLLYE